MQLHKEIGVHSSNLDGLSDLGIRAMTVVLKVAKILLDTFKS